MYSHTTAAVWINEGLWHQLTQTVVSLLKETFLSLSSTTQLTNNKQHQKDPSNAAIQQSQTNDSAQEPTA
jgi:hypothetical protein